MLIPNVKWDNLRNISTMLNNKHPKIILSRCKCTYIYVYIYNYIHRCHTYIHIQMDMFPILLTAPQRVLPRLRFDEQQEMPVMPVTKGTTGPRWDNFFAEPIGSMYAIYGNIYHQYTPNVSIYTIHGSYGEWQRANKGIVGFVYVKSLETMVILANNNKITVVSRHGWFYGVQIHQFESLNKNIYDISHCWICLRIP